MFGNSNTSGAVENNAYAILKVNKKTLDWRYVDGYEQRKILAVRECKDVYGKCVKARYNLWGLQTMSFQEEGRVGQKCNMYVIST